MTEPELTIDDLRKLVTEAKASGISERSVDDIFAEAQKEAERRGSGAEFKNFARPARLEPALHRASAPRKTHSMTCNRS